MKHFVQNSKQGSISVLSLLLMIALVACGRNADERNGADPVGDPVLVVPVAKSVRGSISDDITVTGEFVPYQEIDVMAKVAGYIRTIGVDIGDRVRTGQVLAQLEIPEMQNDITRASAAVEESKADIVTAQDQLNRAKSARDMAHLSYTRVLDVSKREPGLVPQQEVDEAHAKDLIAEAEVSAGQSSLQAAERKTSMAIAEQARWHTLQNYTVITAPFDGVITKRYANTGAMIQAGIASQTQAMPIVRLSENNLLRLILPVPESAVPAIHNGETVDVTVAALQRTFRGRVTRSAGEVQKSTRTMDTEVDVQNPDLLLIPGMYADVRLSLQKSTDVLTVPIDAVDEASGAPQIYAVRDSLVCILPVTTGLKTPQQEEIRSGIQEGEIVITGRHAGLRNGEKVQPRLVADDGSPNPAKGS